MQKALLIKISTITLLSLILLIPLNMISGKITERSYFKLEAESSIAESWTGQQKIFSPILVIPYTLEWDVVLTNNSIRPPRIERKRETRYRYVLAEQLTINSEVITDVRARGIYEVPVYISSLEFNGEFSSELIDSTFTEIAEEENYVSMGSPYLSVALSDSRGINSIPELQWNNEEVSFEPGSGVTHLQNGLHASLNSILENSEELGEENLVTFNFELELRGMKSLSVVPVANQVDVLISSPWQHPNFFGDFLPVSRELNSEGFTAQWMVNSFSTNIEDKLKRCQLGQCQLLENSEFGVKLIEPVDVYLQTDRSVKYGILFIGLSFVAFFIFEVLYKLPIHSIQYLLTGLANAIFYLLLISLSEHLNFAFSYFIATLACVGLLGFYLRSVLKQRKLAMCFTSALALMYAVLYVIIQSEDYALLMGTLLCFGMLALIMMVTKDVEWERVAGSES